MMIDKPKSLEEILRANPDVRAYWREVSTGIAARHEALDAAQPQCATCGGLGYVRAANLPPGHPKFGQMFPCPDPACPVRAQQRHDRYAKLCTLAQIPAGYQGLTFAEWDNLFDYPDYLRGKLDALGAARAFVAARDRGFMFTIDDAAAAVGLAPHEVILGQRNSIAFYGKPGVGKTSLAVSIARALLDDSYGAIYLKLRAFFDALKKTFDDDAQDDEDEILRHYREAPVLIIDEFGIDATNWRKQRAYDLIDYRQTNLMPTIITTNYSADELLSQWDAPIIHRLQNMCHWIEMGGLELRQRSPMLRSR